MLTNIIKILSFMKNARNNGQSRSGQDSKFDPIRCQQLLEKISHLVILTLNHLKSSSDIARKSFESILSVLYDGVASNRRNILSDAKTIFPDLDLNINEAEPSEFPNTLD